MLSIFDYVLRNISLVILFVCLLVDVYLGLKLVRNIRYVSCVTILNILLNHGILVFAKLKALLSYVDYCKTVYVNFMTSCGVVYFTFILLFVTLSKNQLGLRPECRKLYWIPILCFYIPMLVFASIFFQFDGCDTFVYLPDTMEDVIFYFRILLVVVALLTYRYFRGMPLSENWVVAIFVLFTVIRLLAGGVFQYTGPGERELTYMLFLSASLQLAPLLLFKRLKELAFQPKVDDKMNLV